MITVDYDSRDLQKVMRNMQRFTGRSAKSLVMGASIFFAQSGRKLTPIMRKGKKRDIERVTDGRLYENHADGDLVGYNIIVLGQKKKRKIFTSNQDDKRRKIPRRGTAKNAWNGIMASLGRPAKKSGKNGLRLGESRKKLTGSNPNVTLTNNNEFLDEIAPNVASQAMKKATSRMRGDLNRKVNKAWERMWK